MLARYTPLRRSVPMRRAWIKRRKARRIENRKHMRPYVAYIHELPCCCELGVQTREHGYRESMCQGDIEANHAGPKPGVGLKAPDDTCIPMCWGHHRDWTDHHGLFAGWSRGERRDWADAMITECQRAAVPDTLEQARDFAELGLGTVEGPPDGWTWLPIART